MDRPAGFMVSITPPLLQTLIESMPRRVAALFRARGTLHDIRCVKKMNWSIWFDREWRTVPQDATRVDSVPRRVAQSIDVLHLN
ncbi:hypothetical protein TNCV_3019661 [Trichonephila clavipes]|nr:hypothetical protein TNCV_3019661 [Trichonephila clavipes]